MNGTWKQRRGVSFAVIGLIYLFAAAGGILLFRALPFSFAWNLLIADAAATVFVFFFSVLLGNASVYDPYWSVQPPVILLALAVSTPMTAVRWQALLPVLFWGIRLTANWAYTFQGLHREDWRYRMLREKTGAAYPLINFIGIHFVPTLIVYACVLPAAEVFLCDGEWNAGSLCFALCSVGAAVLQGTADLQMHRFRRAGSGGLIRTGLWRWSRHPNYLGEILMWWGVALSAVCVFPEKWYLCAGALANTVLFLIVSIPMAENRQGAKPGYDAYRAQTRMLLPLPRRKG